MLFIMHTYHFMLYAYALLQQRKVKVTNNIFHYSLLTKNRRQHFPMDFQNNHDLVKDCKLLCHIRKFRHHPKTKKNLVLLVSH